MSSGVPVETGVLTQSLAALRRRLTYFRKWKLRCTAKPLKCKLFHPNGAQDDYPGGRSVKAQPNDFQLSRFKRGSVLAKDRNGKSKV